MAIQKTPPQPLGPVIQNRNYVDNKDFRDSTFLNQIKQWIGVAINVYADTVSVVRRENDTFYDGVPADRLRPNTNGPKVILNDVQPAVDRVVSQVAAAFFDEKSVEACAINDEDIEAAEQATKMVRNQLFNANEGKIILRDSIKSAAKYPFGGVLRVYRDARKKVFEHRMDIPAYDEQGNPLISGLEGAEAAARVIARENTQEDFVEWRLIKVREEIFAEEIETESVGQEQLQTDTAAEVRMETRRQYTATYEVTRHSIHYPILVVPPEEFLMDKEATNVHTAKFICQRRFMPRTDILEMWPDARAFPEDLGSVATSYNTNFSNEKQYRRRVHNTLNITSRPATFDSTMKVCMVIEGYIRYDYDGDGIAEWRHFAIVDNTILENTYWDGPIPIILPNLNRDPHRPDEITIAERAKDSTLIKTAMIRGDVKAQQDRTNLQIIAKSGAFPLTGQRKLMEGAPGIIPYGQNEQGQALAISGPLADSIHVIQKPEPSQATQSLLSMVDTQRANQVGVNALNDQVARQMQSTNPATNAMIQQRSQDIQVEDYIMCYGETAVKPLFRIIYWYVMQDADHPYMQQRFLQITGKPSIDAERMRVGEWWERDEFRVNVGLGVDSPDYKNARATQLLQVFAAFNQAMSGQTLPNLLPKMYEGFRDQVASLGYDPDQMLMDRDEFAAYQQELLAQQQQPPQPDPIAEQTTQLQLQMLAAQVAQLQALAQESQAKADKARADADRSIAEAGKATVETDIASLQLRQGRIMPAKINI